MLLQLSHLRPPPPCSFFRVIAGLLESQRLERHKICQEAADMDARLFVYESVERLIASGGRRNVKATKDVAITDVFKGLVPLWGSAPRT